MRQLVVALSLTLAGCVGYADDRDDLPETDETDEPDAVVDPTPDAQARTAFDDVYPILVRKCSGGACHGTDGASTSSPIRFVAADADTTYDLFNRHDPVTGQPILEPKHMLEVMGHFDSTYTLGERETIKNWIELEAKR